MSFSERIKTITDDYLAGIQTDKEARALKFNQEMDLLKADFVMYFGLNPAADVSEQKIVTVLELLSCVVDKETCKRNFALAVDQTVTQ